MPYTIEPDTSAASCRVQASPHRSLPPKGFAIFILSTWTMMMIPGFALLGTAVLWGLLPFLVLAIWAMWYFLQRSYKDGTLTETLIVGPEETHLTRQNPRARDQSWQAPSYWVEVALRPTGGPVANYLTLRGAGRTVEFGAFLSPEERQELYSLLTDTYSKLRASVANP